MHDKHLAALNHQQVSPKQVALDRAGGDADGDDDGLMMLSHALEAVDLQLRSDLEQPGRRVEAFGYLV